MRWQFDGSGTALGTRVGRREGSAIRVNAFRGCALYGPHLTLPAGRLRARVRLAPGASGAVLIEITHGKGDRKLASARRGIDGKTAIELEAVLTAPVDLLEVRLFCRGKSSFTILGLDLDFEQPIAWETPDPARPVGQESGKSYAVKIASGFFDRYLSGPAVMEVGYKGYDHATVPIVPQAIGVDVGYPGYDGRRFPFADASLDAIYSSHCYEHIPDYRAVLRDWFRLLKIGGYLIIVVPHQHIFERKRQMPSRWNIDHQRFYTPRTLLAELESAWDENSYRIRHLVENDTGFDYSRPPREPSHGSYEIELVVEKIAGPGWVVDDQTVRPYPPADFQMTPQQQRLSPYEVRMDFHGGNLIWGPYGLLNRGAYQADFFFDGEPSETVELQLDVAIGNETAILLPVQLVPGRDRHRFEVPFKLPRDGDYFEFRIRNPVPSAETGLTFRGVELRYAGTPPPQDATEPG